MTPVGATAAGGSTHFEVWAPWASQVDVVLDDRSIAMVPTSRPGRWAVDVPGVGHGDRYRFRQDDGEPLADPASRWQPDGVHGASAVVDPGRWTWTDDGWTGVELADAVYYELHVGAFTPDGTLDAAIGELDRLARLGVTLIELMPLNATPGQRNWGYDGVFPSAVDAAYGGPDALARFVDAAHDRGIGVVVDVVYNHLGPEGNVFPRYGPYFVDTTRTPWGDALNVASADSDEVRRLFVQDARQWVEDLHLDGFRMDAVDFIVDQTARTFLEEYAASIHELAGRLGRTVLVVAESASNDPRLVTPVPDGGIGLDGMWNDDVHHCLHVALLGDRRGYYADYDGVGDLAHALAQGWVFDGRYSIARGRTHGRSAGHVDPRRLVVCAANHDQVGNTPDGQRPQYGRGGWMVAQGTVVLGPWTPLIFMGDEYADPAPFPFFVDHTDPEIREATRAGRLAEFADAGWDRDVLDPADEATFRAADLRSELAAEPGHAEALAATTELLALRRRHPVLSDPTADHTVTRHGDAIVVRRRLGEQQATLVLVFGRDPVTFALDDAAREIAFDGDDPRWGGDGATAWDGAMLSSSAPNAVLLTSTT